MVPCRIKQLKIGVLSKIPNIRLEIIRRLPNLEPRVADLLQESDTTPQEILDSNQNEASLGSFTASLTKDCNVLVADMDLIAPLMYHLKGVKWVQSTFAGVDAVVKHIKPHCPYPKFELTRFAGTFGQHMAEYVIGHIIAHERNFRKGFQSQASGYWDFELHNSPYRLLSEVSICILGLGDIGKSVAKICNDFGMKVFGVVSREIPEGQTLPFVDKYYFSLDELPNILNQVDYICNTLPKTPKTDNILSNDILKNCENRRTVLVNIGRGNILSEEDIIRALENKWIGGAILDVFEKEPLPETSKLWHMPDVVVTPHCSGLSFAHEVADIFAKNFELFQNGLPLMNVLDWDRGY